MSEVPDHLLGRVFALLGMLSSTMFAALLLGSGLALAVVAPRTLGLLAGLLMLGAVLAGAFGLM